MKYVGMYTQQVRNNSKSLLLLFLFPCIILGVVYAFFLVMYAIENEGVILWEEVNTETLYTLPWVMALVVLWFAIAYLLNTSMIRRVTGARPLERRENPRVYNIVENLTMACGMPMPKVNVIDDPQLNAFASGIDERSYTVTVTTGICDRLNDSELAGVIGHELTHISNRDTRLLIVSIIFVGIVSTIMSMVVQMIYNVMWFGGGGRSNDKEDEKNNGLSIIVVLIVGLICCAIAYLFTILTRFAISRKREYMADAGGAELCGNPLALASALRKISGDPGLSNIRRDDIAQLFIVHPQQLTSGVMGFFNSLFSTHPDTKKRIEILEQF